MWSFCPALSHLSVSSHLIPFYARACVVCLCFRVRACACVRVCVCVPLSPACPKAGRYCLKCIQMGPPWCLWDSFSEQIKCLYLQEVSAGDESSSMHAARHSRHRRIVTATLRPLRATTPLSVVFRVAAVSGWRGVIREPPRASPTPSRLRGRCIPSGAIGLPSAMSRPTSSAR